MPSIKITNSSDRVIETQYRMPGSPTILKIGIQPRALLNEVNFHTEEHYKEWRRQNELFFKRGILFENEKREALLKDAIANDNKNINNTIQGKTTKNVESLEAAADNVNASIKIETEDLQEKRSRRRR